MMTIEQRDARSSEKIPSLVLKKHVQQLRCVNTGLSPIPFIELDLFWLGVDIITEESWHLACQAIKVA